MVEEMKLKYLQNRLDVPCCPFFRPENFGKERRLASSPYPYIFTLFDVDTGTAVIIRCKFCQIGNLLIGDVQQCQK